MSLRKKILISCVGCMISALVLQTIIFQNSSSGIIVGQTRQITKNTLESLQGDLHTYIKNIEYDMIKIYNNKEFVRDLYFGENITLLRNSYSQIAYDMARSAFEPSQCVDALYVYTTNHNLISSYRRSNTPIFTYPEDIYDPSNENNANQVKKYIASGNRSILITSYFHKKRQINLLRFVMRIYHNTTQTIGYIVCDVDTKNVMRTVQKYRYSEEPIIWLQPPGDRVVLQVGKMTDAQKKIFDITAMKVEKGIWKPENSDGYSGNVLFEVTPQKYSLTVFSIMPQSILVQNQRALSRSLFLVCLLLLGAFFLVSLIISRGLTKPLTYMMSIMNRIKMGETNLRLKSMKQYEFGVLGQEFNDMLNRMEKLISEKYATQILANDARYKALQAQVNPHFLYNTLDTMSGIAASKNCPQVSRLCLALSNLFRYSLNMKDPLSTFEEEILHSKNYMYIMNIRMQDSVQLDIAVKSELLKEKLPRLSLQPLLENALLHGLKEKRGEKWIRLTAKADTNNLWIIVEDNGVGMNADAINEHLKKSVTEVLQRKSSIGLDNINARVKLLFGPEYGISVQSEKNEGSRVTLYLPRKGEANNGKKEIFSFSC